MGSVGKLNLSWPYYMFTGFDVLSSAAAMELFESSRSLTGKRAVLLLLTLAVSCNLFIEYCEGCREQERSTLIEIRDSINNNTEGHGLSWGRMYELRVVSVDDCCTWPGVSCTSGLVTGINIPNAREAKLGTWHPDAGLFAHLEKLSTLNLDGNRIGSWDSPQGLCMLTGLERLNLGKNKLNDTNIPPCLQHLSSLRDLKLQENRLNSTLAIPGLCELSRLQVLDLNNNQLHDGSIPQCLTNLTQLTFLDLSNNQFGGKVPLDVLRNITSLVHVDLSSSQFNDIFPFSMWMNHVNLSFIDLSNNPLLEVETEFESWAPPFQLSYLNLSYCTVNPNSGVIPKLLAAQSKLEKIDLSHTKLTGAIPTWLLESGTKYLDLSDNLLSGQFPTPSRISSISVMYFSNNIISGPLPHNLSALFPSLVNFSMSKNAIEGNILASHCNSKSLRLLDLSDNKLTGNVPSTLFADCPSLEFLQLANNNLCGSLDPLNSTKSKPLLHLLDVSNNFLFGSIKNWIVSLPNLEVLTMHNNSLGGSIPDEICKMYNMRILDLSHNKLSGSLPSCFFNIQPWRENDQERKNTSLDGLVVDLTTKGRTDHYSSSPLSKITTLDLSKNALRGVIPPVMGFLEGLHSINLSYNNLMGGIPTSFQNLLELESLDLSHNQLSGSIPAELGKLDRLNSLSLAFNHLSGKIPQSPHFDTFDNRSYIGNPRLCGKPLEDCFLHSTQEMTKNNEEEGLDVIFYACIMVAYPIGFWGFIALLFFKKEWRQIYFGKIDKYFFFCICFLEKLSTRVGS